MRKNLYLWLIFVLAIAIRFLWFEQNIYFGFDEARDAFVAKDICLKGDFKLIGPPANAPGLNHGVLHWYILGPLYLLGGGSPYFVSFVFRLINALAVFPVFWLTSKLFDKRTALIASLFYAVSFESSQYAIYYGNPSLAVWSWIILFCGAVLILRNKNKFWGLPLIAIGIATGAQLELFLVILLFVGLAILCVLRNELAKVEWKSWLLAVGLGIILVSPYIAGELKDDFRSIRSAVQLTSKGYNVAGGNETKTSVYIKRWLLIVHDNAIPVSGWPLKLSAGLLVLTLLYYARRDKAHRLLLIWIFGSVFVFAFGAYNAYYINVGVGTGVVIGLAVIVAKLLDKAMVMAILIVLMIAGGNVYQISKNNKSGLIEDIKTQQFMLLGDEIRVINKLYQWAEGKSFTIRVTSMPYRIQTVWAYLFDRYGAKKFGYLPYYETGNVLGYPGYLPQPKSGTTCLRFLIREPLGGIPDHLVEKDTTDENAFSRIEDTIVVGHFVIEKRISTDKICQQDNFPN